MSAIVLAAPLPEVYFRRRLDKFSLANSIKVEHSVMLQVQQEEPVTHFIFHLTWLTSWRQAKSCLHRAGNLYYLLAKAALQLFWRTAEA